MDVSIEEEEEEEVVEGEYASDLEEDELEGKKREQIHIATDTLIYNLI